MAIVNISRGGTPDFKGWYCAGQYAEFNPPYDAPNLPATPPFDSHADGAKEQGFLNMDFPLVPNLNGTYAHNWMQSALRKLGAVNDVIFTNWVPMRSFLNALYIEVSKTDSLLDGVYVTPVAYRVAWDFTAQDWTYTPITAFTDEITAAGITQLPLGTPAAGDKLYGIARLSMDPTAVPSTFGHNLVAKDATGKPTGPYDAYTGAVIIGLKITQGDPDKIASIWKSNIAVYLSMKLVAFEGSSQVG